MTHPQIYIHNKYPSILRYLLGCICIKINTNIIGVKLHTKVKPTNCVIDNKTKSEQKIT
jgi:hypothetical protein